MAHRCVHNRSYERGLAKDTLFQAVVARYFCLGPCVQSEPDGFGLLFLNYELLSPDEDLVPVEEK